MGKTIFEQRAEAQIELKSAIDKLKATGEGASNVESLLASVESLDAKCAQAEKADSLLAGLGKVEQKAAPADTVAPARSLGEFYVKNGLERVKAAVGSRHMSVTVGDYQMKGNTDVHVTPTEPAGLAPVQYDPNIVHPYEYPLTIADWLGSASIATPTLTYFTEELLTDKEGDVAWVGENKPKPQVHYGTYKSVVENLRKLAGYIKVSTEMLDDADFIASEINQRLLLDVRIKEEKELLNGDGASGVGVKGLLQRSGVLTGTAASVDALPDEVFRAATKIRNATGLEADGVLMNPEDYETIRLAKDKNGQYYAGGPFYGAYSSLQGAAVDRPPLWGKRVIVTPAIAKGTVLVGAGKQAATVYRKGALTLSTAFQNEDDFINNRAAILAEERLLLAVRRPSAFCKITISG